MTARTDDQPPTTRLTDQQYGELRAWLLCGPARAS